MVVHHCIPETATCVDGHQIAETQSTLLGCRSSLSWSLIGRRSSYRRRGNEDLMMLARCSSWKKMSQPMGGSGNQNLSLSGGVGRQIARGCRDSCRRIKQVLLFIFGMVVLLCRSVVGIH